MTSLSDRRAFLQAGWALSLGALVPATRACEIFTSTLRVTHPWTRATAAHADSAVLCMRFDEVIESDRLVLVETPVAERAEMGGELAAPRVDFFIPQGRETTLEEAGSYVRLVGLRFPLELGRSYPLRLGFEKGGTFMATLSVDYGRFK